MVRERFRGVLVEILLALFAVPAHGVVSAPIAHSTTHPSGQLKHSSIVVTAGSVIVTVATFKKKKNNNTVENRIGRHFNI